MEYSVAEEARELESQVSCPSFHYQTQALNTGRDLLAALGQKYDQYLDFAQQDAHEFLRILLDAMRMEEQDVGPPTCRSTPAKVTDIDN